MCTCPGPEGVHVVDRHGEEVHVGWDGVRVNTTDPEAAEHIFTRDNPFGVSPGDFNAERAKNVAEVSLLGRW